LKFPTAFADDVSPSSVLPICVSRIVVPFDRTDLEPPTAVSTIDKMMLHFLVTAALTVSVASGLSGLPPLTKIADHLPLAKKCMAYIDASPDPFHAVQTSEKMLVAAGFEELDDKEPYSGKLVPGGKYYFSRNKSTLVAFTVGEKYQPGNGCFKVIGGHSDSPNIKVKPRSKRKSSGMTTTQLAVECYGGGLWHTWFDRDLGISGRVLVRSGESIEQRLVKIDRAILRIPNLAIHLQTPEEREAFKINKEDHLSPIIAMQAEKVRGLGDVTLHAPRYVL
jgi:aspartyl aminopeptidase